MISKRRRKGREERTRPTELQSYIGREEAEIMGEYKISIVCHINKSAPSTQ